MENLRLIENEEALLLLRNDALNVQDKKNISFSLDEKQRVYFYENKGVKSFSSEKDLKSFSMNTLKTLNVLTPLFFLSLAFFVYFLTYEMLFFKTVDGLPTLLILLIAYSYLYLNFLSKYKKRSIYALEYIKKNKEAKEKA